MKLLPSRRVLSTPYNHAPCHCMQCHIRKMCACLAVTEICTFGRNDRGLLRATAVTRGLNGYRNKSQHRKLTLEKKILPPLLQGFEPATFRSRVRRSNHWAVPAPGFVRRTEKMHHEVLALMRGYCHHYYWHFIVSGEGVRVLSKMSAVLKSSASALLTVSKATSVGETSERNEVERIRAFPSA